MRQSTPYSNTLLSSENRFHRDVSKHGLFAHAVANIVQLGIMFDELSPFDVYDHFQEPDSWQNEWET